MQNMQYLTIALTKGRLAGQTMELFEKAGYFCEELKDKKSRRLSACGIYLLLYAHRAAFCAVVFD